MMLLWVLLALVVVLLGYVRLAPSDPAQWHVAPDVGEDVDMTGGAKRLVTGAGSDALARLDPIAMATPRTTRLAGSVDEGMVTYVTRTRVIGFPDYTTVQQDGENLKIYARLRFGRSDFGVNTARVEGWVNALQAR